MITVKSNINEFLKNYRKRVGNFKSTLNVIAEKLVERIKADMLRVIENKQFVWQEEAGNLAEIEPSDIDFTTTQVGENTIRVSIGERLPRFPMSDGTLVNPVYFIEFGFGIEGQESPMQNRDKYGWRYNINHYIEGWTYLDKYGEEQFSRGREGTNFLYNTIQTYKTNWKQYVAEIMTEIGNG